MSDVPPVSAEKTPCRECGGIGYYQTEGPGEGGVVLMNCHVCSDGQIIPECDHRGSQVCEKCGAILVFLP